MKILVRSFVILVGGAVAGWAVDFQVPSPSFVVELKAVPTAQSAATDMRFPQPLDRQVPGQPIRFSKGTGGQGVYEKLEFVDGTFEEVWYLGQWVGWRKRNGEHVLMHASQAFEDSLDPAWFKLQFPPGLSWLKTEPMPQLIDNASSRWSYYYQETASDALGRVNPARAWVLKENQVPQAAQVGNLLFEFQFDRSVPVPPVPEEIRQLLERRLKVDRFIATMRKKNQSAQ